MKKEQIIDAIVNEVYLSEEEVKQDVERIQTGLEHWYAVDSVINNTQGYVLDDAYAADIKKDT